MESQVLRESRSSCTGKIVMCSAPKPLFVSNHKRNDAGKRHPNSPSAFRMASSVVPITLCPFLPMIEPSVSRLTLRFSCGARSASKLKERNYLRSMLSRRQLQALVMPRSMISIGPIARNFNFVSIAFEIGTRALDSGDHRVTVSNFKIPACRHSIFRRDEVRIIFPRN